jgi:hypothetical protein
MPNKVTVTLLSQNIEKSYLQVGRIGPHDTTTMESPALLSARLNHKGLMRVISLKGYGPRCAPLACGGWERR